MRASSRRFAIFVVLFLGLVLTSCSGFGSSLDSEDMKGIDEQIRESIEKTFPLPERIVIRTMWEMTYAFQRN